MTLSKDQKRRVKGSKHNKTGPTDVDKVLAIMDSSEFKKDLKPGGQSTEQEPTSFVEVAEWTKKSIDSETATVEPIIKPAVENLAEVAKNKIDQVVSEPKQPFNPSNIIFSSDDLKFGRQSFAPGKTNIRSFRPGGIERQNQVDREVLLEPAVEAETKPEENKETKPEAEEKPESTEAEEKPESAEETEKAEAPEELFNVELDTADIEKAFTDNPDIIQDLKSLLSGKEGGGKELLENSIVDVLSKHFSKFLSAEQLKSIETKIYDLAGTATEQIVKAYDIQLDIRAKEKIGFIRNIWNKITFKDAGKIAVAIGASVTGAMLASVVLPAITGASIVGSMTGGALFTVGQRHVSRLRSLLGVKGKDSTKSNKEDRSMENARQDIINNGISIGTTNEVEFIDVRSLAASMKAIIRNETSQVFADEENLIDDSGHLNAEASKIILENTADVFLNNTVKRLEVENSLRQKFVEQNKNFDALSETDREVEIKKALNLEVQVLYINYVKNLTSHVDMEQMMTASSNKDIIAIQKLQSALRGRLGDAFVSKQKQTWKEDAMNVLGATGAGVLITSMYENSAWLSAIGGGLAGASTGHALGSSIENQARAEAYMTEMRLAVDRAEKIISKAEAGNGDKLVIDALANKIQGLLNINRPAKAGEPRAPFIDDPSLRSRAENFLVAYTKQKLEQGDLATPVGAEFVEMFNKQAEIYKQEQADVIGSIDTKISKKVQKKKLIKYLLTAGSAVSGFAAGYYLRQSSIDAQAASTQASPKQDILNTQTNHDPEDIVDPSIKAPKIEVEATPNHGNNMVSADQDATSTKFGQPTDESIRSRFGMPSDSGDVIEHQPVIKDSIWNTTEENLKNNPEYRSMLSEVLKKDGVDTKDWTDADWNKLDLDKHALGTTAIDKLKDDLVGSFSKGNSEFIKADLTPEQLKELGFDDLKHLDPNNLTSDQMKAIDWDKLMTGKNVNGGHNQMEEVMKAMKLNEDPEVMKRILEHNKALAELAKEGKIDWKSPDFDQATNDYQAWLETHPKGNVDEYLDFKNLKPVDALHTDVKPLQVDVGVVAHLVEFIPTIEDMSDKVVVDKAVEASAAQAGKVVETAGSTGPDDFIVDTAADKAVDTSSTDIINNSATSAVEQIKAQAVDLKEFLQVKANFGLDFTKYHVDSGNHITGLAMDLPQADNAVKFDFSVEGDKVVTHVTIDNNAEQAGLSPDLLKLVRKLDNTDIQADSNANNLDMLSKEFLHQQELAKQVESLVEQRDQAGLDKYIADNPDAKFYIKDQINTLSKNIDQAPAPVELTKPEEVVSDVDKVIDSTDNVKLDHLINQQAGYFVDDQQSLDALAKITKLDENIIKSNLETLRDYSELVSNIDKMPSDLRAVTEAVIKTINQEYIDAIKK